MEENVQAKAAGTSITYDGHIVTRRVDSVSRQDLATSTGNLKPCPRGRPRDTHQALMVTRPGNGGIGMVNS